MSSRKERRWKKFCAVSAAPGYRVLSFGKPDSAGTQSRQYHSPFTRAYRSINAGAGGHKGCNRGHEMPAGRTLYSLGAGLALGALSWGIVPLVSERFEPFDSGVAFLSGQAALCVTACAIGYFFPARQVLV